MSSEAHHAIIDPLIELSPAEETGPGTHFRSTFAPITPTATPPPSAAPKHGSPGQIREQATGSSGLSSNNPFRDQSPKSKNVTIVETRRPSSSSRDNYPTPPTTASPRGERFPTYREDAFSGYNDGRRRSSGHGSPIAEPSNGRRRGSSLTERFPGDTSHRPLDMIKKDSKAANRAPHLQKRHIPGADVVDKLDIAPVGQTYHHGGPYDAALLARNTSLTSSPVAAVAETNHEALKATSPENIQDSLERHRPLDGVATVPPGMKDKFGRTYEYEEGTDMMRDLGGNYKRWPGIDYHPDDLKGKGEPSYTIDKQLKEHKAYENTYGESGVAGESSGIEMTSRPRNKSVSHADSTGATDYQYQRVYEEEHAASSVGRSRGNSVTEGLKKRLGSLRRKNKD
ncbi:hypothetical protein H2201_000778 [Coniosporium apollinis]|uniref:Pal1 cell morphology protein n=1 Tax=Coniosporium apollinis TaxID=61459 RepID=A0ABQ9P3J0_9PEZI|nr:hypothetical protein H2201_000778 [Coniosporium apollinis]